MICQTAREFLGRVRVKTCTLFLAGLPILAAVVTGLAGIDLRPVVELFVKSEYQVQLVMAVFAIIGAVTPRLVTLAPKETGETALDQPSEG